MPKYRINVGTFPSDARSGEVRWRRKAYIAQPWAKAGTFATPTAEIEVPNVGQIELQAYPKDATGRKGKARIITIDTYTDQPPKRTDATDLSVPTPEVRQDDGVVKIQVDAPKGVEPEMIEYEVRASEPEEDEAQSVLVGTVQPNATIHYNAWPVDNMRFHVRPRYRDTGQLGAWTTQDVEMHSTPEGLVQTEDDAGDAAALASWTINTIYGYTPLEISAGLQNASVAPIWNTTNTDSIWGMNGDVTIWSLRDYYPYGEIESPNIALPSADEEFLPVVYPQFDSTAESSTPIWGMTEWPPYLPLQEDDDTTGDFRDHHEDRRRRYDDHVIWNTSTNGDRTPMEIKQEIQLPTTAAWEEVVHGRHYKDGGGNMNHKITFKSRLGTRRFKATKLQLLRWVRNKKWEYKVPLLGNLTGNAVSYTFDPVPIISGTPHATVAVLDTSTAANISYTTHVTSLSATAITVDVYEVDASGPTFGAPSTADTSLYIILAGT